MLLQSHNGEVHLLPCLPEQWKKGKVAGLVARGGFEVSVERKDGKLLSAEVLSKLGNDCRVRYKDKMVDLEMKKGGRVMLSAVDFK